MSFHARVERGFERWGRLLVGLRWPVVILSLLVTAAFAALLPRLRADNSNESFLRPSDPARVAYEHFKAEFGQDQNLFVAIRPPALFDLEFLEKLRRLHRDIEREVPYVEEVTSLINARNVRGEDDELIVEDLLEEWPETENDLEVIEQRVRATPSYHDALVNADLTVTTLVVEPAAYSPAAVEQRAAGVPAGAIPLPGLSEAEYAAQVRALAKILARHEAPDFELFLAGGEVGNLHLTRMLAHDVAVTFPAATATMFVLLFALFRRVSGVVLPLAVASMALVATLGIMVLLDIPSSISGQVLPLLILAVGVSNSVHLLAIAYQRLDAGQPRRAAIASALGHSGPAVVMTSLTTAGGLFSFVSAGLRQVAHLGIVAPVGIVLTLAYTLVLLPALLAVIPLRATRRGREGAASAGVRAVLRSAGGFAASRPRLVLGVTAALIGLGALGLRDLRFSQNFMSWFPPGDPVRRATELIDRELGGSVPLELLIDTGRENGIHDPAFLRRLEAGTAFLESRDDGPIRIGKASSIVDVVKELNRALHENRQEHYALPEDRDLVAQELFLFELSGSDDLEDVTDSQFRTARLTLRTPVVDGMHYPAFIGTVTSELAQRLGDVEIRPTGLATLYSRTSAVVNTSMARSYLIALLIVTPLLALWIGSVRVGLLAAIPNAIPVLLTLCLMGWLDIPIDNSSLLVGCIVIGLSVDDTIHFMHRFRRYERETWHPFGAVRRTLESTGVALLFTSLVLTAGFLVLTLSYMRNAVQFGLLAAFATSVAFLADVLIAPALLALRGGARRASPGEASPSEPDRI